MIDELPPLRKPEIERDDMGRFDRRGKTLRKVQKKTGLIKKAEEKGSPLTNTQYQPGHKRPGPGRPPGSRNKASLALKEMILGSLDRVGGEEYLAKLAIENSSAYASLLGKVLPMTLAADGSDNLKVKVSFTRTIVYPNGQKVIDGAANPVKELPAPDERMSVERLASHIDQQPVERVAEHRRDAPQPERVEKSDTPSGMGGAFAGASRRDVSEELYQPATTPRTDANPTVEGLSDRDLGIDLVDGPLTRPDPRRKTFDKSDF